MTRDEVYWAVSNLRRPFFGPRWAHDTFGVYTGCQSLIETRDCDASVEDGDLEKLTVFRDYCLDHMPSEIELSEIRSNCGWHWFLVNPRERE